MPLFGELPDLNFAPILLALVMSCVMTPVWVLGLALFFRWVVRRIHRS